MALLDREAIERGLSKIDARARAAGVVVDLSVYGGAALILAFDTRRSTRDVDAVVRGALAVGFGHQRGYHRGYVEGYRAAEPEPGPAPLRSVTSQKKQGFSPMG